MNRYSHHWARSKELTKENLILAWQNIEKSNLLWQLRILLADDLRNNIVGIEEAGKVTNITIT